MAEYLFPDFPLLSRLPWLSNVSVWSAPPIEQRADVRDSFLLGGGGRLSARLGTRDRVSSMERIMAPYLSSYNFGENANFRRSEIRPSRDFYPPFEFIPHTQHIWRVLGTAIVITAERDDTFELVTVNGVHPTDHMYVRYASLKNISGNAIQDIGLSFSAPPDIPYPVAGHRSLCMPLERDLLSERLEEMLPMERDFSQHYSENRQRFRFMVRGVLGSKSRGYDDLFVHTDALAPDATLEAIQFMCPALDDREDSAVAAARRVRERVAQEGSEPLFMEIKQWWDTQLSAQTRFEASEPVFTELIDSNLVMQHATERATGGWVVIDDYTGSWLRDNNGSHILQLDLGAHERVLQSMDRYYALDCSARSLYSFYASDLEPKSPLPSEPDWERVEGFVTGDVPNFRTMWYWWYWKHTGDLDLVRERFEYIKGAFMRQRLHENGYLASYCFDETYGIGPVGPMRTGLSADNSFNALAAAQRLAEFSRLLERPDAEELQSYARSIHEAIEQTFWLEEKGYYAMRQRPDGSIDDTPFSIGLLCPLWIGSAKRDDEHAIRSVLCVLDKLYRQNGFIRLIDSHDQTVTMTIGYLLFAMKKIRHPGIDRVLRDTLKWADPSGTFGEYLDEAPDGPRECYEHMAHRNRIWESGINTDAVFYALTGYEPDLYYRRVRLEPYVPEGWSYHKISNHRVDEHRISLDSRRSDGRMTYMLEGNFREPFHVDFCIWSKAPDATVFVNGTQKAVQWSTNRFGISHATLELTLEITTPVTIEVHG